MVKELSTGANIKIQLSFIKLNKEILKVQSNTNLITNRFSFWKTSVFELQTWCTSYM